MPPILCHRHRMPYAELAAVKHLVRPGVELPFNVRDRDGRLLLSAGHLIEDREQLDSLFLRGALVDIDELRAPSDRVRVAPRSQLPGLWNQCLGDLTRTLQADPGPAYTSALDDASAPVQVLIERDPDLAIFQVLRQVASPDMAYGAHRALQTAITAHLVAQRMGWDAEQCVLQFKVALTMNVSMLELQGQLARQFEAPTPAQRLELQTHPMRSLRMLELAGVRDRLWLQAVLQHHEVEGGGGYPSGRGDVCDLASLARRADVYTAKLAARATREALAADQAGREMFMNDPTHPMNTALVREFGIYPPGCFVRLQGGELALVVARGASITAPVVVCLTTPLGTELPEPQRVALDGKQLAVAAVIGQRQTGLHLPLDRLADWITAP